MKGSTVMKQAQRFALVAILVSSFAAVSPSHAQMGGMDMREMDREKCKGMARRKCKEMMGKDKKGMEMQGMGADKKSEAKSHKGAGTVKKVDPASGKVTIAHGPIPTMKWPAMNMTFIVKDKAMLGKFSHGKQVDVDVVEQGSDYLIKSVK